MLQAVLTGVVSCVTTEAEAWTTPGASGPSWGVLVTTPVPAPVRVLTGRVGSVRGAVSTEGSIGGSWSTMTVSETGTSATTVDCKRQNLFVAR